MSTPGSRRTLLAASRALRREVNHHRSASRRRLEVAHVPPTRRPGGEPTLRRLVADDACAELAATATRFTRIAHLTVEHVDEATAPLGSATVDRFVRRAVAGAVRRSGGSVCPRRIAATVRLAGVLRCAVRGELGECRCLRDLRADVVARR